MVAIRKILRNTYKITRRYISYHASHPTTHTFVRSTLRAAAVNLVQNVAETMFWGAVEQYTQNSSNATTTAEGSVAGIMVGDQQIRMDGDEKSFLFAWNETVGEATAINVDMDVLSDLVKAAAKNNARKGMKQRRYTFCLKRGDSFLQ